MAKLGSSPGDQRALLTAALEGLQLQKERIEVQIQQVRAALGLKGGRAVASPAIGAGPAKRELSEAARKRIAAAQRKRWIAYRKAKAESGK